MVKNYTRRAPGFQFVLQRASSPRFFSSRPIVRDEYFKTNTRNFHPMFARFPSAFRSPPTFVSLDLGRESLSFLSTPLPPPPPPQSRVSYFFVRIRGESSRPIDSFIVEPRVRYVLFCPRIEPFSTQSFAVRNRSKRF